MLRAPQLDLQAPPLRNKTPWQFTSGRISRIIFATAIATSAAIFLVPRATAQDLGEIARQERAKRQNNPAPPATHVYTNEDLQRQQILTPEDQTRFSATTQPAVVKTSRPSIQVATQSTPPGNADPLISARPPILATSAGPATTSTPTRAKTDSAPTARANIAVASATSAKSVPTPQSQPTANIIPAATTQPSAQIPVTQIVSQSNDAPVPTTILQDDMSLGDVARYYRLRKHEFARANAQIDPGPANAPSASALATTIPNALPLNQMSLGDVARYYRAKKREETEQHPQALATIQAPPSEAPASAIAPTSKYPLTLSAMPLASPKRTPTRALRINTSPIAPSSNHPIAHPTTSHALVAKRSVGAQATSIRITSGDTLWQLARKYLGSATRWTELLALNPTLQNPKHLQVGTQLVLRAPNV